MKKIWSYLAVGFAFLAAGIVIGVKLVGDTVKMQIKNIKNKRSAGGQTITIPLAVKAKKRLKKGKGRRKKRRERREKRKQF